MTMTKTASTTTATTNRINQVGVHHHHHHHQQQQSIIPMTNSTTTTTTTNDDNIDVDDDCDGDSGLNQDIDHHHHHHHDDHHDEDINKIRKKHCSQSPTLTPTISSSASSTSSSSPSPSPSPSTSPRSSILAKLIDNKNNHLFSDNNDSISSNNSSSSSQNSSCSNPASTLSQSHQHQEQQQLSSNIRQIDGKMQKSSPTPPPPPPPITIPRRSRQRKPVDLNNNNRKSTIDTSIVLLKKEKITRLDMVPDNDDEQNRKEEILTPVEIDSFNDGGVNGQTNKKKKINQKSMMDWKLKLTKELDLYQQILIERQQQQQSSHSAETNRQNRNVKSNVNHHHCHCHHHHHHAHCHQQPHHHHHHYHQKSTKPLMKSNSNSNKQDSLGDSSWEETTTTSNTSEPANNVIITTPPTTTTTTESNEKKSKKPTTFLRGSRSASSQKSTTSWSKPNSQSTKNPVTAKRRSASFNKQQPNVRIITPYERIRQSLQMDKTWQKEIAFGRRIGLYRFRGDIGNGNFSQVKIAIHSLTKEKVAIKILDKSRLDMKTQKMLAREIRTMETLHHPNLIRIFEVIESFSKHFLIMELAPGGELFQVISTNGRFSELEAKHFFAQIISAIDHMHQHNLIHRDIKAENVFFSDPITVKVGDFGFSTRITSRDELLSTFCGSPPYAAPELFRDESYRGPYVDYWALGVLLYFIVTGMMPFRAQNIISLKKLILDCHYDIPNYVSLECCQLINGFLQSDPLKRFTLDQARHTRWLQNQLNQRSLPKYDLKSSYGKLIRHRKMSTAVVASESIDNADHHHNEQYPPLNDDEKETFHQLMLLGIDEKILNDHIDKGSHSHIVGTFRILMHRILRQSSNERQQRKQSSSKSNDITTIGGDQWNPIRRTTSMSVAPLERIRAHYARKIPATKLVDANSKCPKLNDKSKNSKQLTKTIESSNDSTEKSRLQKIHNAINRTSTPPPPSKSNDQPESIEMKKDPSAKHMKNVLTKQNSESNQEKESKQQPSSRKFLENCIKNDNQHSNTVSSRLSRSFRTLKQLLTENNICGNNHHTTVVQPQTINIGGMNNKPHVIHKTTTLQIMPRSNPAKATANPLLWPSNSKTGGGGGGGKLWRSQTTPDVSLIDGTMCIGNHAHHHHNHNNNHRTLPCYHCDNQHYILPSSSNKKSFINPVNRCAII